MEARSGSTIGEGAVLSASFSTLSWYPVKQRSGWKGRYSPQQNFKKKRLDPTAAQSEVDQPGLGSSPKALYVENKKDVKLIYDNWHD